MTHRPGLSAALAGNMFKWLLLLVFGVSIAYVQLRGAIRQRGLKPIFDHSALLAPLNVLLYGLSSVPTRPFVALDRFPGLDELQSHWPEIRAEAVALSRLRRIKASEHNDDAGFNSFFKEGWKRFYLKWYDERPPSAERYCPRTVALLQQVPSIKAALFAELPHGAKLNPHRDPYAGSLRYHLGLDTPNDDRCCIWVDGQAYSWRDGQGVVFDETYVHWVRNDTDRDRLILLCDVERPLRLRWAQALNRAFSRYVMSAAASPNESGDHTGIISRLFRFSHIAGQHRRRFKQRHPLGYRVTRYALVAAAVMAIVYA